MDIAHIAKLAKLRLTPEEETTFAEQLPAIVAYIAKLQEVDTSNVDTKTYLTGTSNVFRVDESKEDASERAAVMESFPEVVGGALEVPGVFAE